MLAFNRLRIDAGDGSPVVEYRIENGCVERRTLEASGEGLAPIEEKWQPLRPEQLSSHVAAGTVVARWLRRRMGIFKLIRACVENSSMTNTEAQERRQQIAA